MSDGGEWRAFPLKRRGVVVGVGVVVGRGAVHLHVEEPPLVACFQVSGLKEGRHRRQGLGRGHEGRGRGQEGGGRGHGEGVGECSRSERTLDERWRSTLVKVKCGRSRSHNGAVSGLEITSSGDRIQETRKPFYIIIQNYTKRSKLTKGSKER